MYIVIHRFSYVQSIVNTFLHHSFCQLFSYPVNRAIIETRNVQSTSESIGKSAPAHSQLLSHSVEQSVIGPFSTAHKLVK